MVIMVCPTYQEFYLFEYYHQASHIIPAYMVICSECGAEYPVQQELRRALYQL